MGTVRRLCLYGLVSILLCPFVCEQRANSDPQIQLSGRVVGPDGKAIQDARIYLFLGKAYWEIMRGVGQEWPVARLLTKTRPDGSFDLRIGKREAMWLSGQSFLVAMGPQSDRGTSYGIDWNNAWVFDSSGELLKELNETYPQGAKSRTELAGRGRVLQLTADTVPIEGTLVDDQGEPVAGATVRAISIQQMKNHDISGYLRIAARRNPRDYDVARQKFVAKGIGRTVGREPELGQLLQSTTDSEGRFRLLGIGRERAAWLTMEGPGVHTENIFVRTQHGGDVEIRDGDEFFKLQPADFRHAVTDSVDITGTVRDRDTKKPIPGVLLRAVAIEIEDVLNIVDGGDRFQTVSNQEGKYCLRGLPAGRSCTLAVASMAQPYLPQSKEINSNDKRTRVDFGLELGIWIQGSVTDAKSRAPIYCRAHYFAFADNPHLRSAPQFRGAFQHPNIRSDYCTDAEGNFRLPGLPGRGLVAIQVIPDSFAYFSAYQLGKSANGIPGLEGEGMWASYPTLPVPCEVGKYHGIEEVTSTDRNSDVKRDFHLQRSTVLIGKVLDPDGKPLVGAKFAGSTERSWYMFPLNSEEFFVENYQPNQPRRLLFWHEERKLAGTSLISGVQRSPLEVRLQPQGALTGRIVDSAGKPQLGLVLSAAPLMSGKSPTTISALPEPNYTTDREGRFRIEGVAPGMNYNVATDVVGEGIRQVILDVSTNPGETKELGDLQLRPFFSDE